MKAAIGGEGVGDAVCCSIFLGRMETGELDRLADIGLVISAPGGGPSSDGSLGISVFIVVTIKGALLTLVMEGLVS